jgi:hypothetical protein
MVASPTPRAKKHVAECVANKVCLCGCGRPAVKRGLAEKCYNAFMYLKRKLGTRQKAAVYESNLIRAGRLLPSHAICGLNRKASVFSKAADEVA